MKNIKSKKLISENFLYINITDTFKINLLIIPVFFAAFKFGYISILMIAFITAFLHELSHIAAIKLTGSTFKRIVLEPFGISAQISESSFFNSTKEMLIAVAGPLFNYTAAAIILIIKNNVKNYDLSFILTLNLSMGFFNSIPALPLDGGRFLRAFLSNKFGIIKAYNFMISLSKFIIATLLFSGAVIIVFSPFNFSLIIIVIFMFSNLCCERSALSKIILKDILSTKNTPENIHQRKNKIITVNESSPARIILKVLSFDYYINIIIINSAGRVKLVTTETEVINLLIDSGIRAKFSDLIINKNFT